MTVEIVEKNCNRCRLTKPTDAFSKDKRSKDGLCGRCKDCRRERYEANKSTELEQCRRYQVANKDKVKEQRHRYLDANKRKVSERRRQYREANLDKESERLRRWRNANREAQVEYSRKYRAGGRPAERPWPDRTIGYSAAHLRVKAIHGAASDHPCSKCGEQADEWSYDYSDPNPLLYQSTGRWADRPPIPYSPDPERYDPMCHSCHVKRDRYGAA